MNYHNNYGALRGMEPHTRTREPKAKILIVEDDRDTLTWLTVLLRQRGYETFAAEDGAMAMGVAYRKKPDLIILDMALPAGNGMFVLESIRKHDDLSLTPVIILSGAPDFDPESAMRAGATRYFSKPARNDTLLEAIESSLAAAK